MEYSKLVAVTGMPGLYELVNTKNDGAIVRSLEDNSTRFASSRIHNFSHLESIEIYTTGENVNLVEIFYAMEKATGDLPDGKDNAAVKKYFEKVYPELDFERVYTSDLKKMIRWFEVLKKNNVEIKLSAPAEEPQEEAPEVEAEEKKPAKPAGKKPGVKEDKAEKAPKPAMEEPEEKPAKPKKTTAAAPKAEKKEASPDKTESGKKTASRKK
jgi:hypothetical protein